MTRRHITIAINGAEYLELEAGRSREGARSLAQYIRFRCGLAATITTKRGEPLAPRDPVRLALERRTLTINVDADEYAQLVSESSGTGLTLPKYVRTRCGLAVRNTSLPGTDERDDEKDDAWDRLQRLGIDPAPYFED